jgi:hypothetical protein
MESMLMWWNLGLTVVFLSVMKMPVLIIRVHRNLIHQHCTQTCTVAETRKLLPQKQTTPRSEPAARCS